jgi:hypothetical protein
MTQLCALAIVGLTMLTAGCAAPAPKTAFVAYGDAGNFGYSDSRLGDNLYQVTYVTPFLPTATDAAGRDAEIAQQKQQAYELALWRAAQLAQKGGFPALQIENHRNDANIFIRSEPDYVAAPTPLSAYYEAGPLYRPYPISGFSYGFPHGYTSYTRHAVATITVQLRVRMLQAMADGAIDSKATEAQLASRYAKATYPSTPY